MERSCVEIDRYVVKDHNAGPESRGWEASLDEYKHKGGRDIYLQASGLDRGSGEDIPIPQEGVISLPLFSEVVQEKES